MAMRELLIINQHINDFPKGFIVIIKNLGDTWTDRQTALYYAKAQFDLTDNQVEFLNMFKEDFRYDFDTQTIKHISGFTFHIGMCAPFDYFNHIDCFEISKKIDANWIVEEENPCKYLHSKCHSNALPGKELYPINDLWGPYRKYWIKKLLYLADKEGIDKVIWVYRYSFFGSLILAWQGLSDVIKDEIRQHGIFNARDKEIIENIWQLQLT